MRHRYHRASEMAINEGIIYVNCVCIWQNIHYVSCYMLLLYTNNMKTDVTMHGTSDCLKSTRYEVPTYHIHYA